MKTEQLFEHLSSRRAPRPSDSFLPWTIVSPGGVSGSLLSRLTSLIPCSCTLFKKNAYLTESSWETEIVHPLSFHEVAHSLLTHALQLLCLPHLRETMRWRYPRRFKLEILGAVAGGQRGNLLRTARGIGGFGDVRMGRRRAGAWLDLGWRGTWNADALIHGEMFFGAARAIALARVFIAQAGQFIAAVDAIAVARG